MPPDTPNVPPHLRRFVVEQDYAEYNAVDQAVWRFVLLSTRARLVQTAHPAYREGLSATGISVERIPRISEMHERLSRFGWAAVCVDGFIPPRAFQEFQALGILPIAADIRTRQHLVYTPAPDIIHEAAGHAPILTDPVYAAFLRGVGELGQHAFTLPAEERIYQAIYTLSEVKENPALGERDVLNAERELQSALASVAEISEATRTSRLYWWTAEYGLVGNPEAYRLYGAGLLSSLWESYTCHDPGVRKIPLDESCTEVSYDITSPQPQLFVVRDFETLHKVLGRVRRSMAVEIGGAVALTRALASQEVASSRFASGAWLIGKLSAAGPSLSNPGFLEFSGPVALADRHGCIVVEPFAMHGPDGYIALVGSLSGTKTPDGLSDSALRAQFRGESGRLRFCFESGVRAEGRLERPVRASDGRVLAVELSNARVSIPERGARDLERYTLIFPGRFQTSQAGAVDSSFYPDTVPPPNVRVPRARRFSGSERALIGFYEQAERAHASGGASVRRAFSEIHEALADAYPAEWLLRWNLLEILLELGMKGTLTETLERELEELERRFEYREPIASGLDYLRKTHPPRAPLRGAL